MNITSVQPRPNFHVHLIFDDGTEGVVDLSGFAGRGVFEAWLKPGVFEQVALTTNGAIAWPGELDLCPDSLFLRLTGKSPEEIYPSLQATASNA